MHWRYNNNNVLLIPLYILQVPLWFLSLQQRHLLDVCSITAHTHTHTWVCLGPAAALYTPSVFQRPDLTGRSSRPASRQNESDCSPPLTHTHTHTWVTHWSLRDLNMYNSASHTHLCGRAAGSRSICFLDELRDGTTAACVRYKCWPSWRPTATDWVHWHSETHTCASLNTSHNSCCSVCAVSGHVTCSVTLHCRYVVCRCASVSCVTTCMTFCSWKAFSSTRSTAHTRWMGIEERTWNTRRERDEGVCSTDFISG